MKTSQKKEVTINLVFQIEYLGFHHEDFSPSKSEPEDEVDAILVGAFSGVGHSVINSVNSAVDSTLDAGIFISEIDRLDLVRPFMDLNSKYQQCDPTETRLHHAVVRIYGCPPIVQDFETKNLLTFRAST